jgi:hypothetical protein
MRTGIRHFSARAAQIVVLGALFGATLGVGVGADVAAGSSARPATTHGCRGPTVDVVATGVPVQDRRNIQGGIDAGQATGRCVRLSGQFNVGACGGCLRITAPVTIVGQGDPTDPAADPTSLTVVRASRGRGLLVVDEPATAPEGDVVIRDVWWRGSTLSAISVSNFHGGTLEIVRNKVTHIDGALGQRFAITSNGLTPGNSVSGDHVILSENHIDTTTGGVFVPILLGDDNGIAFLGTAFDEVDITGNTLITHGENEYELTGGSRLTIADNYISTTKRVDTATLVNLIETVGYPLLTPGGLPSSIALRDTDFKTTVLSNNHIVTGGGARNGVCILFSQPVPSAHPSRSTSVIGNRCDMGGIFAGISMGWFGATGLLPPGILDGATITDNTFTGRAAFGLAALDYRYRVPFEVLGNLHNTSHHNRMQRNDFSAFTPGRATLYLGPSTHDNTFIGSPHGPVVNLGTNNRLVLSSG